LGFDWIQPKRLFAAAAKSSPHPTGTSSRTHVRSVVAAILPGCYRRRFGPNHRIVRVTNHLIIEYDVGPRGVLGSTLAPRPAEVSEEALEGTLPVTSQVLRPRQLLRGVFELWCSQLLEKQLLNMIHVGNVV
jgi:hypothetical protein